MESIIKKLEKLTTIPPIHVSINKTNNRLKFKIKLQTPETMKLFGSRKNNRKNKKWTKSTKS